MMYLTNDMGKRSFNVPYAQVHYGADACLHVHGFRFRGLVPYVRTIHTTASYWKHVASGTNYLEIIQHVSAEHLESCKARLTLYDFTPWSRRSAFPLTPSFHSDKRRVGLQFVTLFIPGLCCLFHLPVELWNNRPTETMGGFWFVWKLHVSTHSSYSLLDDAPLRQS